MKMATLPARILSLPNKVLNRLIWAYRRRFQGSHQVFIRHGPYPPELRPDVQFVRYAKFTDVPDFVRQAIVSQQGQKALDTDQRELQDHSVMWVAVVDGVVAGICHSRMGHHFQNWFVPLNDDDIVIFRARTYQAFRGRGISPSLDRYIMHRELSPDARAFVDCAVYNKASRRSIQKAGFKIVATMKPISRDWALYGKSNRNP